MHGTGAQSSIQYLDFHETAYPRRDAVVDNNELRRRPMMDIVPLDVDRTLHFRHCPDTTV
jgi:hypothetical protein